ncbi:24060_t:CDS:2, partial [Gigaspora margarita]
NKNYSAIYYNEKEQNIDAFVNIIDKGLISCDTYRDLTALEAELLQEYNVANEMSENTPIFVLDIKNSSFTTNDTSHIIDKDIEKEMLQYVGKVGYRPITNILVFIIPDLVKKNILNKNNPIVHLRISGDGQNVGKKIKYMMITCTILDDILNIYRAECYYTIVLYPSGENYEILQNAIEPIINELHIDHSTHNWSNTPLMGDDKETVMRNFNFEVIFDKEQGTLINRF